MQARKVSLKEEKGAILFLVILFTAALLLLGTAFLRSSLQEKLIARNYTQKIRAHYLAEAGMEAALTLLKKQPDYFLHNSISGPVYIHSDSGQKEEYFRLEWLEPGNPAGHEEYYTLKAYGFARSTFKNRSARAVVKTFVRMDWAADENGAEKISVSFLDLSGQ